MKKYVALLIGLAVLISAQSAFCFTFDDPTGNVWANPGDPALFDRIGSSVYEIYGMDALISGRDLTLDIFTNFGPGGEPVSNWTTYPADLAIDLNNDSVYEYGVVVAANPTRALGTGLYSINTGLNLANDQLNGWYLSNHFDPTVHHSWPASGAGFVYHENQIVSIAGVNGGPLSGASVSWLNAGGNPNNQIHIVLNDFLPVNYSGDMNFFYGGATCANDYIGGSLRVTGDTIPEPATMTLLGVGLAGLLLKRKKRGNA